MLPITRDKFPQTIFNRDNHTGSLRYSQIATIDVLDKLEKCGWVPVKIDTSRAYKKSNDQVKHLIRLQHVDTLSKDEGEVLQMLMVNSHDCSAAYRFMMGIFRFICSNGLVTGDIFQKVSIRHVGDALGKVEQTIGSILDIAPTIHAEVDKMRQKQLEPGQIIDLCKAAYQIKYPDINETLVMPEQLATVHRQADVGNDVWRVFNRVQENLIRGRVKVLVEKPEKNEYTGNTFTRRGYKKVRSLNNIEKNVKVNRQLWDLFSQVA